MARTGRPKKWTEENIRKVADDFEKWFLDDEEMIFYQGYFAIRPDLHPDMVARFRSVSDYFDRKVKRVEKLAQMRLAQLLVHRKSTPVGLMFYLKCQHGWVEKQHVIHENHNFHHKPAEELKTASSETLQDLVRNLTGSKN